MSPYNNKWSEWSNRILMIKAKYNTKQKEIMYERDKYCVLCWDSNNLHFHHCYFWTESMYTKDRNDPKYWITCCATCHLKIHSCSKWEWKRQQAIDYVTNL